MCQRDRCVWLAVWFAAAVGACNALAEEKIRVLSHGPGAGHYLTWRGKPILLCGDSVTQGWMECGPNFDQDAYLEALSSRGINLLMLWAFKGTSAAIQQKDARIGYDAPELMPWCGSADRRDFDLRQFNNDYFDRLEKLVVGAEQRLMVVLITVHDGWTKTCFDGHPFNMALGNGPLQSGPDYVKLAEYEQEMPERYDASWNLAQRNQYFQERFCSQLIARLDRYSNVIYEMFNEGEWYPRDERRRHEQHFLAFFRKRCTNVLLTNTDHIFGDDPQSDPKVDGISWHPRDWMERFDEFADAFRSEPAKPYYYSEPVPEFDGQTPSLDVVRRSAWETLLAGAAWVNQNDTSFGWDRRAAIAARATVRDTAYDIAGRAATYMNRSGIPFWEMEPHGELASSGICMARPGFEYVAYSPSGEPITLRFGSSGSRKLQARWFNPRTGATVADNTPCREGNVRFTPPFVGDAVLHVSSR